MKKITNSHFRNFKEAVNICCKVESDSDCFLSDMQSASCSKNGKEPFYSDKYLNPFLNMETIKLDDISKYRRIMLKLPEKSWFNPLAAVDAVCIDEDNEWYFIEFKDAKLDNEIKSIKKKMLNSLWFCFFMIYKSNRGNGVINQDVLKFSREHITYIVVISRDNNIEYAEEIKEKEGCKEHFHHRQLIEVINYYFKDVYVLTEYEFRDFIRNFKS